jgi:AraC-like DNA-binding protein
MKFGRLKEKTMPKTANHLSETDIRTEGSEQTILRASREDQRPWIVGAPLCSALLRYKILHMGEARMRPPFEIVRSKLGGTYFLACLKGKGRVLLAGRWKACCPGRAFLLSAGTLHAFHSAPSSDWSFCWVRFEEDAFNPTVAEPNSPVLASFNGEVLRHAILGLYHEVINQGRPEMEGLWSGLVFRYIQDFAKPQLLDFRLVRLFAAVERSIAESWNNKRMAESACLSERQLERICLKELGRTPRQHLIWLRMHQAAELLSKGEHKIEYIAAKVGYQNPFSFSVTFKRCMGWPPSEYRVLQA